MNASVMKIQGVQCELCGGGHQSMECQVRNPFAQLAEQASYVNNFRGQPNNPYSSTYHLGWRNHPNFSWSNNQGAARPSPGFQHPPPPQEKKSNLEDMMTKFISVTDARFHNKDAYIKNLENQVG